MTYYNSLNQPMPESAKDTSSLTGTSAGGEVLTAPPGPSAVAGAGGGDTLIGSSGDNIFWITDSRDQIIVSNGQSGVKTAMSYQSYALPANVHNLTVYGSFNYAAGNNLANLITVTDDQWVYGGAGNDVLVGGAGRATFQVNAGEGSDVIYGWHFGDQVRFGGTSFTNIAQIKAAMTQAGADVVLQIGPSETLTFRNTTIGQFAARDFLLPLDQSKLGPITFGDEFTTLNLYDPSIDTGVWQTNFGGNLKDAWAYTLVSNGELQAYTTTDFRGAGDHALGYNPFSLNDGVLTITAQPIAPQDSYASFGAQYSSGMINTLGTFEQQFGYFEIRAELPPAPGAWPAFWLEPDPFVPNLEADIMEGLGVTPHIHYARAYGTETLFDNAYKIDPSGFHTYGMLWTPATVSFYYDGVAVLQGPTPSNWTQPLGLIANLAVGGWGGAPDSSLFPARMNIDYIRVYDLTDGSAIVEHTPPEPPAATIRADGSPLAAGQAAVQIVAAVFEDSGAPVTSKNIIISMTAPNPNSLPPGENFLVWDNGGAVFAAWSDGSHLGTPTPLMAGSTSQFAGGTWLTDGNVALVYMQMDSGVQNAWGLVFNMDTSLPSKQQLGPATGSVHIAAIAQGGFAVSWNSQSGVMGRAYDAHAYDGDGWYGPLRPLSGDLLGMNSTGELVTAAGGGARQIYDVVSPADTIPPSISASPKMITQAEGSSGTTIFTYTLTRSWDVSGTSSVDWFIAGSSAHPADAADFQNGVLPFGTVTFAPGESTKTVIVNIAGDTQTESDETFTLTLNHVSGSTLGTAVVNGTITNDDGGGSPALPSLSLSPNLVSHTEGDSGTIAYSFTLTRSGPTSASSSVTWSVAGSGAEAASAADFQNSLLPSGTIAFAAGETAKTIAFNIAGDTQSESDESFTLTLTNPSGATLAAASSSGIIVNDDSSSSPQPTVETHALSYTLDAGFFNLLLSGSASQTGNGNGLDNIITSNDYGSTLNGIAGNDTLVAGRGADMLTGGPGADTFVFRFLPWNAGHIADFNLGSDILDLSALLAASNYTGSDPVADAYVIFASDGAAGTKVYFDTDGRGTANPWAFLITALDNVSPSGLTAANVLNASPPASGQTLRANDSPGQTLNGGAGNDTLYAGHNSSVLTGGGGNDSFVYQYLPWNAGRITDFAVGSDVLDLRALFSAAGYTGSDPVADAYVILASDGAAGTKVYFDPDGRGTANPWAFLIAALDNVSPSGLTAANILNASPSASGQTLTANDSPGQTLNGGTGNDTLYAGHNSSVLTGGGGNDSFVYQYLPWNAGRITDFAVGSDVLDLRALFSAAGYAGSDPMQDNYLTLASAGAGGTNVLFDSDGVESGNPWPFHITTLEHIAPESLHMQSNWLIS